jgi:hypothetical protein
MFTPITRRGFVGTTLKAGALAGLGNFAFLHGLPAIAEDEAKVNPKTCQLSADIEPLVRFLEETPRDKLIAATAEKVRQGTSYQQLLSAVLLAGVRGIKPRPVGFKFHAVLVINSAHLASLAAQDNDRWLPLFWALDNYKNSQATNIKEGGWMMPPVDEAKVPPASAARKSFIEAMDNWDEEAADAAVVSLARSAGAEEVIELFWRYGARDFRDIGHKAIYVANSWRALQTVGWRHAEPVLRSLALALLEHEGENPAKRDADADRPGRNNLKRLAGLGQAGVDGKRSADATAELLAALRTASPEEASEQVAAMLKKGIHPGSLWDGVFLTAAELLMRQPGIVGLHCMTSANALHYAARTSIDLDTRRLMLLQAAAFLTMFRQAMLGRGKLSEAKLDALEKEESKAEGAEAIEEVFKDLSKDRTRSARWTLALLEKAPAEAQPLMAAGRRLIFTKGRDSHDYKFSSAALEDYYEIGPRWRNHYLAASMFNLKGASDPDNNLIERTRAALARG